MATIKECALCGEELPTTHLCYVYSADGYYCDCCIDEVRED